MRLRLALVLLGAWLGLSLAMGAVATLNFGTVDRVLEPGYRADLARAVAPRTLAEERPILRYLASELNRRFFRGWGWAQAVLAVALLALVMPEPGFGPVARAALLTAVVLAGVNLAGLMPLILRLGPPFDFVPRPVPAEMAAAHARFFRLHGAYMVVELLKLVVLVVGLVGLVRVRERPAGGDTGPGRRPGRVAGL